VEEAAATTTAPTATELRVKKCQCLIFSPSSGAKKTKNSSSVSSARLLKFDGRMTFLSYFCQSDNDENTNENNKTEAQLRQFSPKNSAKTILKTEN